MSTSPRSFIGLAASAMIALAVAGCGRTEGYRYKLTLAVNTPDGVKRASSVGQVRFRASSLGVGSQFRGEALYLDLGPDRRPLIALLTHVPKPRYQPFAWSGGAGPNTRLMGRLYGIIPSSKGFIDDIPRFARLRGPHSITPDDLPDLVTFADVNNPNTVIEVDPSDLPATLGPGVSWNEITLESTGERLTTGIKTKLPWLDGDALHHGRTLANNLSPADFDQSKNDSWYEQGRRSR